MKEEIEKSKTMADKINDIHSLIDTKKEREKKSIISKKIKLSQGQVKKNFVSVFILYPTGNAKIEKVPIIDNSIQLKNGNYHVSSSEYIYSYENKHPFMILPSWDMKPISKARLTEITAKDGTWTDPQKILIHYMNLSQVKPKAKVGMSLIWIIIGAVVVLYLLNSLLGGGQV